jgi:hypothetical protein
MIQICKIFFTRALRIYSSFYSIFLIFLIFQNFGFMNIKFVRFLNSVHTESAEFRQKPSNLLTLDMDC